MIIIIEKNIPLPSASLLGKKGKYPFGDLKEVGDSFFYPDKTKGQSILGSGKQYIKNHKLDWTLCVKKDIKDNIEGVRVWRTK